MNITIIGAGQGISLGVAKKFGSKGYKTNLISRSESQLIELVNTLKKEGIDADFAIADASNASSLQNALHQLRDRNGHSDMILYNAAALDIKDFLDQEWSTYQSTLNVNVGGAFHLLKTVLPFCIQNDSGKLFFTGGGLAFQGNKDWTTLSVGKAALRNLIQAAQEKVKDSGIHIAQLTVCGYVNPKDEKYSPEAIANQYWKLFNQKKGEFELEVTY
ncbi:MAG: SDR family NAD(P)-dependent oxidoreductase [Bacteroidetes bacterium]|nr:SDR family NAD(P)-dependent oxidoreductase [Bacteroidota bacterium]